MPSWPGNPATPGSPLSPLGICLMSHEDAAPGCPVGPSLPCCPENIHNPMVNWEKKRDNNLNIHYHYRINLKPERYEGGVWTQVSANNLGI